VKKGLPTNLLVHCVFCGAPVVKGEALTVNGEPICARKDWERCSDRSIVRYATRKTAA
jgi:hypothetical protein